MGNTNPELERRIAELERKIESFAQNNSPNSGSTVGQTWWDEPGQALKVWNGSEWKNVSFSLPSQSGHSGEFLSTDGSMVSWDAIPVPAGSSFYANVYSKPGSTGTVAYTGFGFQPKMVMIEAWTGLMRSSTVWLDGGYKGGLSLYLNSSGTLLSTEITSVIMIEDDTPVVDIYSVATGVSMDSDGITLNWTAVDIPCGFTVKAFG